jgi:antitoxin (DNA-binding transcriptional repressor) of toxin-antitoxin stability system
MIRLVEPISESTIGVRACRQQLPTLLSTVRRGRHVVHITRSGARIAALVSPDVAAGIIEAQGEDGPVVPGDLAGAIKIVERLLIEEGPGPDLRDIHARPCELVGATITFVDILLSGPALGFGELPINNDEESERPKLVAGMLIDKLYRRPDVQKYRSFNLAYHCRVHVGGSDRAISR